MAVQGDLLCLERRSINKTHSVGSNVAVPPEGRRRAMRPHLSSRPTQWTATFEPTRRAACFQVLRRIFVLNVPAGMPFN